MNRRNFLQSGLLGLFAALRPEGVLAATAQTPGTVRILGIGGAGLYVINRLVAQPIGRVVYSCIDTDRESLALSKASHNYLSGCEDYIHNGTRQYGARRMAYIRKLAGRQRSFLGEALGGADYALLIGGLAGGTGGGVLPVLAEIARANGASPLIIGILPFPFEGAERRRLAELNANLLQTHHGSNFTLVDHGPLLRQIRSGTSLPALYESGACHIAAEARRQIRIRDAGLERFA